MAKVLLFAIRIYQRISRPFVINTCRFYPSCSQYASQAIDKHGALKGFLLSIWRIMRCSPLSKGGFDPVKEPTRPVK